MNAKFKTLFAKPGDIKSRRLQADITQSEFATLLGVSLRQAQRLEYGHGKIYLALLDKVLPKK